MQKNLKQIREGKPLVKVEKNFINMTSAEVTAAIFEHWQLSNNLINLIKYVDNPQECTDTNILKK